MFHNAIDPLSQRTGAHHDPSLCNRISPALSVSTFKTSLKHLSNISQTSLKHPSNISQGLPPQTSLKHLSNISQTSLKHLSKTTLKHLSKTAPSKALALPGFWTPAFSFLQGEAFSKRPLQAQHVSPRPRGLTTWTALQLDCPPVGLPSSWTALQHDGTSDYRTPRIITSDYHLGLSPRPRIITSDCGTARSLGRKRP